MAFAKVIVIAVKPDGVVPLLTEVKDALNDQHILLSIAAGVTIATIESVCMLRLMMSVSALSSSVIALVCE